jgi:hypothetical protein
MVVLGNVPKKSGAMGENRVCKFLTRRHLSSASFPKRPWLGSVRFPSRSLTAAPLLEVVVSVLPLTLPVGQARMRNRTFLCTCARGSSRWCASTPVCSPSAWNGGQSLQRYGARHATRKAWSACRGVNASPLQASSDNWPVARSCQESTTAHASAGRSISRDTCARQGEQGRRQPSVTWGLRLHIILFSLE